MDKDALSSTMFDFNKSGLSAAAYSEQVKSLDTNMKAYLSTVESGGATLEGYEAYLRSTTAAIDTQTIATKLGTVAAKAFNMAVSMIIAAGVSWAISKALEVYDNVAHAKEKLDEAATKAKSDIQEINNSLQTNVQTVDDVKKRYAELAQGVDQFTGKNVSLSTDDYKEFLSLSDRLSKVFPTLTKGYDDNGHAILDLSGNVDTIVTSLDNLVKVQQKLASEKIMEKLPTVFKDTNSKIDDNKDKVDQYRESIAALENFKSLNTSDRFNSGEYVIPLENYKNASKEMQDILQQKLNAYGLNDTEATFPKKSFTFGISLDGINKNSSSEDFSKIDQAVDATISDLRSKVQSGIDDTKQQMDGFKSYVGLWLDDIASSKGLDKGLQSNLQTVLDQSSGWMDSMKSALKDNFSTADMSDWLRVNIIDKIVDMDEVHKLNFSNLFSKDIPDDDKIKLANDLQSYFDQHGIKLSLDFITDRNKQGSIPYIADKFNERINQLIGGDDAAYQNELKKAESLRIAYEGANAVRKLTYSSSAYIGNVNINKQTPVMNGNTSFTTAPSTTSSIQKNDGSYELIHFTPILPDGTRLDSKTLSDYLTNIVKRAGDTLDADNKDNGGLGIIYKVDTEFNDKSITKDNLNQAEKDARKWDTDNQSYVNDRYSQTGNALVDYNKELQNIDIMDKYKQEKDKLDQFFSDYGIDTAAERDEWLKCTEGCKTVDDAIKKYLDAKQLTDEDSKKAALYSDATSKIIDTYQDKLSKVQEATKALNSGTMTSSGVIDLIQQLKLDPSQIDMTTNAFKGLKEQLDKCANTEFNNVINSLQKLLDNGSITEAQFDSLKTALMNTQSGTDALSSTFGSLSEATQRLQSDVDFIAQMNQSIKENQGLTSEVINQIITQFPACTDVCSQYLSGLASTTDVLNAVAQAYQSDLSNYQLYYATKNQYDTNFYQSVIAGVSSYVQQLAAAYGVDLQNYKNLAEAKLAIAQQTEAAAIQKYENWNQYGIQGQSVYANSGNSSMSADEIQRRAQEESRSVTDDIMKGLFKGISLSVKMPKLSVSKNVTNSIQKANTPKETKTPKAAKTKNTPTPQDFDFIERRINKLNNDIDKTQSKLNDQNSTYRKRQLYGDLERQTIRQISTLNTARDSYKGAAWDVHLKKYWRDKVKEGGFSIATIKDETLKKQITEYTKWIDKANDCQKQIRTLDSKLKEYARQRMQVDVDRYDVVLTHYKTANDQLADQFALMQKNGGKPREIDYDYQILNNNRQIDAYKEQNALLERMKYGLSDTSVEYSNLQNKIESNDNAMIKLITSNYEFRDSLREFRWKPFTDKMESFEKYATELNDLKEKFSDENKFFDEGGGLTDEANSFASITALQIENSTKKIDNYRVAIKKLEDEYRSGNITQETYNNNLDDYLAKIRESSKDVDTLRNSLLDLYEKQMTSVNDALDKEIEKRKSALDAKKEYYQYNKTLSDKNKDINAIKAQIAALDGASTMAGRAKKALLESQLKTAQDDLDDTKKQHQLELMSSGYDKLETDASKVMDDLLDKVKMSSERQQEVISDMLANIKNNYSSTYQYIMSIVEKSGIQLSGAGQSNIDRLNNQYGAGSVAYGGQGNVNNNDADNTVKSINTSNIDLYWRGYDGSDPNNYHTDTTYRDVPVKQTCSKISLSRSSVSIKSGSSYTVYATTTPSNCNVLWKTSNSKIATVTNGTIKAHAKGRCTITATSDSRYATISVTVTSSASSKPQVSEVDSALRYGSIGDNVKTLQEGLNNLGFTDGYDQKLDVNGAFDSSTEAALKKAQRKWQLSESGVLDTETKKQFKAKGYLRGTHSVDQTGIFVTNEKGEELKLQKLNAGEYTFLNQGSKVFTHEMTENLWKMARMDLSKIFQINLPSTPVLNTANININYDKFIEVNGNLDSTVIPDIKAIQRDITKEISKTLYNECKKLGMK